MMLGISTDMYNGTTLLDSHVMSTAQDSPVCCYQAGSDRDAGLGEALLCFRQCRLEAWVGVHDEIRLRRGKRGKDGLWLGPWSILLCCANPRPPMLS
jgi:hypothetical protein